MPLGWYVDQAPVVEKIDSAIHWINRYPADNALTTYPLDSNKIYLVDSAIQILNNWGQLLHWQSSHIQPTLNWYSDWYVKRHLTEILADTSVDSPYKTRGLPFA